MIGTAQFSYKKNDIIALIKKDIIDKFGHREIAEFDFSNTDCFTFEGVSATQVKPISIKVTTPEEIKTQLLSVIPKKPPVPRMLNTISQDSQLTGGDDLQVEVSNYDIKVRGSIFKYASINTIPARVGHYVGLTFKFPEGFSFTLGAPIPYSVNGDPFFTILMEENITSRSITLFMDASCTDNDLVINWDVQYEPERFKVHFIGDLEVQSTPKIPAFPAEPQVDITYPEPTQESLNNLEVLVDFSKAK